jgi:copper chaperone CopZ
VLTKRSNTSSLFATLAIAASLITSGTSAVFAVETHKADTGAMHQYNANALRRLDFRVVGKSCAVCLHKMQDRMKTLPGTVKAEVMLKPPYGAVVIYDSTQVNKDKILEKCKEGVEDVQFENLKDVAVKALPLVLIPEAARGANEAVTKIEKE